MKSSRYNTVLPHQLDEMLISIWEVWCTVKILVKRSRAGFIDCIYLFSCTVLKQEPGYLDVLAPCCHAQWREPIPVLYIDRLRSLTEVENTPQY